MSDELLNNDLENYHKDFNEVGNEETSLETNLTTKIEQPLEKSSPQLFSEKSLQEKLSVEVRLREIYLRDQQYRSKLAPERLAIAQSSSEEMAKFFEEQNLADRVNRLEVQAMLDEGQLKTDSDFSIAAIIFQHGEVPADFKKAFELSLKAVNLGEPVQGSLAPKAFDRYMINVQLEKGVLIDNVKQRFNTQTYTDSRGNRFKPALDGQATAEELQLFNIPLPDSQGASIQKFLQKDVILTSLEKKLNNYQVSA